jgi:hypothetical protein
MDLTYGAHVVNITNHPITLVLDYAIYDDGIFNPAHTHTSDPAHTIPTGAIFATSVIAALLLMANLAQLSWYRRSKKLQGHIGMPPDNLGRPYEETIDPLVTLPPSPHDDSYHDKASDSQDSDRPERKSGDMVE